MRWFLVALACSVGCSGGHPSVMSASTDDDDNGDVVAGDPNDRLDVDPTDMALGDGASFLHVVCAGDSLSASVAYRGAIEGDLAAQGHSTDLLDASRSGASSAIADTLAARLDAVIPDVGVIWTGLDDAIAQTDAATTLAAIRAIIGHLRDSNPQVMVVIAEVPDSSEASLDGRIAALDAGLSDLVASSGSDASPVVLVTDRDSFDPAVETDDGVHPNDAGASAVGHLVAAALQPRLD